MVDPTSNWQSDKCEGVVPSEEDLVETRITWDLGKALGFKVCNKKDMISALSKVSECQDFVLPKVIQKTEGFVEVDLLIEMLVDVNAFGC